MQQNSGGSADPSQPARQRTMSVSGRVKTAPWRTPPVRPPSSAVSPSRAKISNENGSREKTCLVCSRLRERVEALETSLRPPCPPQSVAISLLHGYLRLLVIYAIISRISAKPNGLMQSKRDG
ncbi:unnamed protein product [Mesocestoides corti]|uniref:Uncharacterized protein n=1 Tax=Mesocestoides corti TaxID=53468 RepID=A0A0R3UEF1_MESCO|nr:unnamed protein product [Mesocestoides corti]